MVPAVPCLGLDFLSWDVGALGSEALSLFPLLQFSAAPLSVLTHGIAPPEWRFSSLLPPSACLLDLISEVWPLAACLPFSGPFTHQFFHALITLPFSKFFLPQRLLRFHHLSREEAT